MHPCATLVHVPGDVPFRNDLYVGTADHYDRFRPPYPAALLADLAGRVPLGRTSCVLDLACGTGQIASTLVAEVGSITAVDQEGEAVAFGAQKARRLGLKIEWIACRAEDLVGYERYDLVAIGNAFHRLDRTGVAQRMAATLAPGACVALLWGDTPWTGERPWQRTLERVLDEWKRTIGDDRVPAGWDQAIVDDPHPDVLVRAGFASEGRFEFSVRQAWTVEALIGYVYSTSFLNRVALGDRTDAFEHDLRTQLEPHGASSGFEHRLNFAYDLFRK